MNGDDDVAPNFWSAAQVAVAAIEWSSLPETEKEGR